MSYLIAVIVILVILWAISAFFLKGEDLSPFDRPIEGATQSFPGHEGPSKGHWEAVTAIEQFGLDAMGLGRKQRLAYMRKFMDDMGCQREYSTEFVPVDADGIPAEWVLAPGSDSSRRVLYIHGGAFIAGSLLSHRNVTSCYAEMCGAAVLAIDYRLMPENRRQHGIDDCRTAYQWILDHGPDGPEPVSHLVVSGDSAGGNLCLSLAAWVRDQGLRAPDAVVALSPTVDATFTSPSIVSNIKSDVMLGPLFSVLLKIPTAIRRWLFVLENRFNPANPVVSPVFGDLSNLPPTLVQVSEAEMLFDDARRYVNKARSCGSQAVVQSWAHMMHVWHIFYPEVEEAGEAWDEIRKFVDSTR
jgi:monoterpene epsilon-lactone hydrolase